MTMDLAGLTDEQLKAELKRREDVEFKAIYDIALKQVYRVYFSDGIKIYQLGERTSDAAMMAHGNRYKNSGIHFNLRETVTVVQPVEVPKRVGRDSEVSLTTYRVVFSDGVTIQQEGRNAGRNADEAAVLAYNYRRECPGLYTDSAGISSVSPVDVDKGGKGEPVEPGDNQATYRVCFSDDIVAYQVAEDISAAAELAYDYRYKRSVGNCDKANVTTVQLVGGVAHPRGTSEVSADTLTAYRVVFDDCVVIDQAADDASEAIKLACEYRGECADLQSDSAKVLSLSVQPKANDRWSGKYTFKVF